MTPEEYGRLLWQGSGRAVLFARARPDMSREYREAILDACLHCRVYDYVFEGTRSAYMQDVIAELPDRADYERGVIAALLEPGGGRDKLHRQCFVATLAKQGNAEAMAALYRHFPSEMEEIDSFAQRIVYADGLRGFRFVVKRVLELPDTGGIEWFLDEASEMLGAETVEQALLDANLAKPLRETPTSSNASTDSPIRFAKEATDADLLQGAEKLVAAIGSEDWQRTSWFLRVFRDRDFPLDPEPLLKLAQADPQATQRCSHRAIYALKNLTHPAVRALGCERRKVNLILRNFQPGDHRMVLDWYSTEEDDDLAHWMESDLIKLWQLHPQPETEVDMLLGIYERSGCSICRRSALKRLIELEKLPPGIREECRWDASDDIRELVQEKFPV